MKALKKVYPFLIITALVFVLFGNQHVIAQEQAAQKKYYGIEINGVLCGYLDSETRPIKKDGKALTLVNENLFIMLSLLGSKFNTEMAMEYYLEPVTNKCTYFNIDISQAGTKRNAKIVVENGVATINSIMSSEPIKIEMTPDIIFGQDELFVKMKKDFVEDGATEKTYRILEGIESEVHESTVRKLGEDTVELAGQSFDAMIFEQQNLKTGVKVKYWVDMEKAEMLQLEVMTRRVFLADHTVVDKIKVANMDENIIAKSNVVIVDVPAISYMKVKAKIEPTGLWATPEGLNVPGQKFEGTVDKNLIEGIFEIEHKRYDGSNAPAFPPDFSKDKSMNKYLASDKMVAGDDPVLAKKAKEITEGAKDSWEAACRLSNWVAENIAYAIPGGVTARKTYDIRAGECGAHSFLLASFCRAVGIPARVVWGCMYIPNYGGAFGQHGWNEIYMGDAGWIPVDATAHEHDYVDSGHIRVSEYQSASTALNPISVEILDYRAGAVTMEKPVAEESKTEKYADVIGNYTSPDERNVFKVFAQNDQLNLDIPNKAVVPFHDANENGIWICKFTPDLYLMFIKDDNGKANELHLHQIVPLTKISEPDSISEDVPENFKPYLGTYLLAAMRAEFSAFYKDGSLVVHDPLNKKDVRLQAPDENGGWLDEFNKNTIFFEQNDAGKVERMKINSVVKLRRGQPVATIIEKIIEENGVEKGLQKYHELKKTPSDEYFFSEKSLNLMGYRLLNKEKFHEAIAVFKLNVEEYPESFNVYDSLGEAFMKSGDSNLAIENYKKSLDLNPENENAVKMLEKLESGK